MRKKKKYLLLYYKWMEAGRLPKMGLCNCFPNSNRSFKLLTPTENDKVADNVYWAYGRKVTRHVYSTRFPEATKFKFTPLRQNIVLLMAALNDEL